MGPNSTTPKQNKEFPEMGPACFPITLWGPNCHAFNFNHSTLPILASLPFTIFQLVIKITITVKRKDSNWSTFWREIHWRDQYDGSQHGLKRRIDGCAFSFSRYGVKWKGQKRPSLLVEHCTFLNYYYHYCSYHY